MRLLAIELWNFCCFSHYRLNLDSRLIFIEGKNGSGKTVLGLWGPCWIQFGKLPIDKPKEKVIKDGTTTCKGTLHAELNGKRLVIDRKITKTTNHLTVTYGDEVMSTDTMTYEAVQKMLMSLLPYDFKTFVMFYMSSKRRDSYKDFLHASNTERFKLLEDTLPDLRIINKAVEICRSKQTDASSKYSVLTNELARLDLEYKSYTDAVLSIQNRLKESNDVNINGLEVRIRKTQKNIEIMIKELSVLNKRKEAIPGQDKRTIESDITSLKISMAQLRFRESPLVKGQPCPVCKRPITEHEIEDQESRADAVREEEERNKARLAELEEELDKFKEIEEAIREATSGRNILETELNGLMERMEEARVNQDQILNEEADIKAKLAGIKDRKNKVKMKADEFNGLVASYDKITAFLKAMKVAVVSNIQHLLSEALKRYGSVLTDYEVVYGFPEGREGEFPVDAGMIIDNYYRDFDDLSEGQQRRIEASFLMAFQELFSSKFMLLDEMIFYGLDAIEGVRSLCSLINTIYKKGMTIIVISQDPRVAEYFDDKIMLGV